MAEDKFSDVYFMLLVDLDGDAFAIIEHSNGSVLFDVDLDFGHPVIPLVIICGIDQDLIKDFVQAGDELDFFEYNLFVV